MASTDSRRYVEGGKRLTGLLLVKGFDAKDLCARHGFNERTFYSYLNGWRRPSLAVASKLSEILDIPLQYVFCTPYPRLDGLGDFHLVAARASLDLFLENTPTIPKDDHRLYEQIAASAAAGNSVEEWRAIAADIVAAVRRFELERAASMEAMGLAHGRRSVLD